MLSIAPVIIVFWVLFVAAIACGLFFMFLLDVLFPALGVQEAAEPLFDFSAARSSASSASRSNASQPLNSGVALLAAILSNPANRADRVCLFPPLCYPVKAQATDQQATQDDDSMLLFMIRDMSSFLIVPFVGYLILQFLFPLYPSL